MKSISKRKNSAGFAFAPDLGRLRSRMRDFGLRIAESPEVAPAVQLAEELTGSAMAEPLVVSRVHETTGMTAFVTGDPIDGVFLIIPLSERGVETVRSGTFTPGDPRPSHLCHKGKECFGVYIGVFAGQSRDARRNVMHASAILRVEIFASVPCFARAATEDGARAMASLGFAPAGEGLPELWVQEALTNQAAAA